MRGVLLGVVLALTLAPAAAAHVDDPSQLAFLWPAQGTVTSPFGWTEGRWHPGVDIGILSSLDVRAAASGRVRLVGNPRGFEGYGNVVVVGVGGPFETIYAHLAAAGVRPGEVIDAGTRSAPPAARAGARVRTFISSCASAAGRSTRRSCCLTLRRSRRLSRCDRGLDIDCRRRGRGEHADRREGRDRRPAMRDRRGGRLGLGHRSAGARLLRIDPATNKVVGSTALDSTPCELHGALGSLWIVTQSGKIDRVDPASGEVVARIPVGRVTYDLAFGAGSIWVTNREGRTVQRISPATNRVTKTLRFPGGGKPAGIAFSRGGLWIGDDVGTAVYRLDAKRLRWQRVPTRQLASSWVAASPGAVWVSNTASNSVTRIDTARRRATTTVKVCASPVNLEVVGGDVWVPCDRGNALARISVKTRKRIETIPMPGGPAVVAGGAGDVWASAFEAGEVWRLHAG